LHASWAARWHDPTCVPSANPGLTFVRAPRTCPRQSARATEQRRGNGTGVGTYRASAAVVSETGALPARAAAESTSATARPDLRACVCIGQEITSELLFLPLHMHLGPWTSSVPESTMTPLPFRFTNSFPVCRHRPGATGRARQGCGPCPRGGRWQRTVRLLRNFLFMFLLLQGHPQPAAAA
jgi:hypothetical protein